MVTMRSAAGIKPESTLSSVVLPLPVPPEIRMLTLAWPSACSTSTIGGVRLRLASRFSMVSGLTAKRRIDRIGPSIASGGMMAFTREPSGRRASTIGLDSSTRRPTRETIFSMIFIRWALSLKVTSVSSRRPARSTYTMAAVLTRMSETPGSASSGSSGPKPSISCWMSSTRLWRSC